MFITPASRLLARSGPVRQYPSASESCWNELDMTLFLAPPRKPRLLRLTATPWDSVTLRPVLMSVRLQNFPLKRCRWWAVVRQTLTSVQPHWPLVNQRMRTRICVYQSGRESQARSQLMYTSLKSAWTCVAAEWGKKEEENYVIAAQWLFRETDRGSGIYWFVRSDPWLYYFTWWAAWALTLFSVCVIFYNWAFSLLICFKDERGCLRRLFSSPCAP